MDKTHTNYRFYLEPYTFIFHDGKDFVIYNTINGAYVDCSPYPSSYELLRSLYNSDKNYCMDVSGDQLDNENFTAFVDIVRNTFSGDLVEDTNGMSPFIFKPLLRIYSRPEDLRAKEENLLGLNSLLYLHEVTFMLENLCEKECGRCHSYYRQFPHCTRTVEQQLKTEDYIKVIDQLELCQLDKIRVIPGNGRRSILNEEILDRFRVSKLKKEIVFHYSFIPDEINLWIEAGFRAKIMVHFPVVSADINKWLMLPWAKAPDFVFVVTKEDDLRQLEILEIPSDINKELVPFYDGTNNSFFEKFVYNDLKDILDSPISKQFIFRRQVLNENFFGKLFIFPDGKTYANVNFPAIGDLTKQKLTEIVYKEISESTSWLLTRDKSTCRNCVNKYLCPSPSSYEIVMNKYDLCHIASSNP